MVPIGPTPLLGLHLHSLHELGASVLVVNTHHRGEEIRRYINSLEIDVHVKHEPRIRGTAGGVAGARDWLRGAPVLLVNSDIVGDLPVRELLEDFSDGLSMAVSPRAVGVGTVGIGSSGQIVRLRGEVFGKELSSGDYMGVALIGSECLETLPPEGCLIGDWALPKLRRGGLLTAVSVKQEFEDIGTPRSYWGANMAWLAQWGTESRMSSYQASTAQLAEGVTLLRSVIGENASILGSGVMEECVILPGARALAPLKQAIVTPGGVVMDVSAGLGSRKK